MNSNDNAGQFSNEGLVFDMDINLDLENVGLQFDTEGINLNLEDTEESTVSMIDTDGGSLIHNNIQEEDMQALKAISNRITPLSPDTEVPFEGSDKEKASSENKVQNQPTAGEKGGVQDGSKTYDVDKLIGTIPSQDEKNGTLNFQALQEGVSFSALVFCKSVSYKLSVRKSPYLLLNLIDGLGFRFRAFLFDVDVSEEDALTLTNKVIRIEGICTLYQNVKSIKLYTIDANPDTELKYTDFVVKLDCKKAYATGLLQAMDSMESSTIKKLAEGLLIGERYLNEFAGAPFTEDAGYVEGGLLKGLHLMLKGADTYTSVMEGLNSDLIKGGILLVGLVLFKAKSVTSKRIQDILSNELTIPTMEAFYEVKKISRSINLTHSDRLQLEYIIQSFDFRINPTPPKTQESLLIYNLFKMTYEQLLFADRVASIGGDYMIQEGQYKIIRT